MNYKLSLATVMTVICFVSAGFSSDAVAASDSGLYVGLGWGHFDQDSELSLASTKDNQAGKGYVGYQWNKWLGFEGGLADFDNLRFDLGGGNTDIIENNSYYARANFQYAFVYDNDTTVALLAGGGAHRWDITEVVNDSSGARIASGRANGVGPMAGVGVMVRGRNSALRIDYELFADVGDANKIDLYLASINFVLFFK